MLWMVGWVVSSVKLDDEGPALGAGEERLGGNPRDGLLGTIRPPMVLPLMPFDDGPIDVEASHFSRAVVQHTVISINDGEEW
jgi:hypothetical protein